MDSIYFSNKKIAFYVLGVLAILLFSYFLFFSAPNGFKAGAMVNIERGAGLRNVSYQLKNEHIIRSRLAFEVFVIIYGGEKHLIPADYLFENKLPVFEIARRVSEGETHLAPIKITIPEGFDVFDIAEALDTNLPSFDRGKFLQKAELKEGYLFPDTYFFFTTDNEEVAFRLMSENFEKKIEPIRPKIIAIGKTEKEIIIMASIIEKEAKGETDRGFISGILWKRLAQGMPLQVDAAPETYKVKGLPKSPIANPGLSSINFAIYPENSPYLYYLHDSEGGIHFARNFEEHKANKEKYLK